MRRTLDDVMTSLRDNHLLLNYSMPLQNESLTEKYSMRTPQYVQGVLFHPEMNVYFGLQII